MKLKNLIIFLILLSCSGKTKELQDKNRISKQNFTKILTEIQIVEATYELNKVNNHNNALSILKQRYSAIYTEYNISEYLFEKTLSYYSENPAKLEDIYYNTLEKILSIYPSLNLNWLITGIGTMYVNEFTREKKDINKVVVFYKDSSYDELIN